MNIHYSAHELDLVPGGSSNYFFSSFKATAKYKQHMQFVAIVFHATMCLPGLLTAWLNNTLIK
jgi:hypothetical protein